MSELNDVPVKYSCDFCKDGECIVFGECPECGRYFDGTHLEEDGEDS